MKKIHLILTVAAGILCFSASFGVSWFLRQKEPLLPDSPAAAQAAGTNESRPDILSSYADPSEDTLALSMSERQLQNLIQEIRDRMNEYRSREKQLAEENERVQLAQQTLQEEAELLNQLRNKITVLMQSLDQKEQALQESMIEIQAVEKKNFERLAAMYDKMDSVQAGVILSTMASGPQAADAVKILYYMGERNAAKILGEIGKSRPELAALINLKLKGIKESG